jgi:hypothetical protein
MNRDDVAFPDPNEIAPHAVAFAGMMFAHAEFEREVRSLIDAINPKEPGFRERRENQWTASDSGTATIMVLIMRYHGLSQTEQIRNVLSGAVGLCRQRNFLAQGTWWCFNHRTKTVKVRGGVRWEQSELPPEHREYTVSDIESSLISSRTLRPSCTKFVVLSSRKCPRLRCAQHLASCVRPNDTWRDEVSALAEPLLAWRILTLPSCTAVNDCWC